MIASLRACADLQVVLQEPRAAEAVERERRRERHVVRRSEREARSRRPSAMSLSHIARSAPTTPRRSSSVFGGVSISRKALPKHACDSVETHELVAAAPAEHEVATLDVAPEAARTPVSARFAFTAPATCFFASASVMCVIFTFGSALPESAFAAFLPWTMVRSASSRARASIGGSSSSSSELDSTSSPVASARGRRGASRSGGCRRSPRCSRAGRRRFACRSRGCCPRARSRASPTSRPRRARRACRPSRPLRAAPARARTCAWRCWDPRGSR